MLTILSVGTLAQKLEVTSEEVLAKLKENYDGYHFTYPSPDIYNPFSLLNAFADGKFNYQDEYQKAISLAEQIATKNEERMVG